MLSAGYEDFQKHKQIPQMMVKDELRHDSLLSCSFKKNFSQDLSMCFGPEV